MMKRLVSVLLLLFVTPAMAGQISSPTEAEIFAALRAGHMTGFTDEDVQLRPLGTISVGKKRYVFVDYHWEQSKAHAVGFPHAADRLLVLTLVGKRLTYIGFYDEDMKPTGIRGNKVIFPYPKSWGNALTIGENGLQAEPWFGGRTHALGK